MYIVALSMRDRRHRLLRAVAQRAQVRSRYQLVQRHADDQAAPVGVVALAEEHVHGDEEVVLGIADLGPVA